MSLAMLLEKALRFPTCEFIPRARFENETTFASEWFHDCKLTIQARPQCVKFLRSFWRFPPANSLGDLHCF
jgi:hypothetical protein